MTPYTRSKAYGKNDDIPAVPLVPTGERDDLTQPMRGQDDRDGTSYPLRLLFALQRKLMYEGTVDRGEVARRRDANKRARQSRRVNRVRGV